MTQSLSPEFKYVIRCSKPETICEAISMGLDLRMLNLASIEIWNHMAVISDFVNAGGVLTVADLSFAVRNPSCNLAEVLDLAGADIFKNYAESSADDEEDSAAQLEDLVSKSDICISFISSEFALMQQIMRYRTQTILEDIDTVFNVYGHKFFMSIDILDTCLTGPSIIFFSKIITKFMDAEFFDQNAILRHLFFGRNKNKFNIPIDENVLLDIIKMFDVNSIPLEIIQLSINTYSSLIVEYFLDNGFDLSAYCESDKCERNLLIYADIKFMELLKNNGCDLKPFCKHFVIGFIYRDYEVELKKMEWLIDNVIDDDVDLRADFKTLVQHYYSTASTELKKKLGIKDQN
jgi:hypothetical protein